MRTVYRLTLDDELIAKGNRVSVDTVREIYRDARMLTKLVEYWAGQIYGMDEPGRDCKGYDLISGSTKVSVKCLTERGADVSGSVFQGAGRTKIHEEVVNHFLMADDVVIVDIRKYPVIDFIRIPSERILEWVEDLSWNTRVLPDRYPNRKYSPSWKVSPERFDDLMKERWGPQLTSVTL